MVGLVIKGRGRVGEPLCGLGGCVQYAREWFNDDPGGSDGASLEDSR